MQRRFGLLFALAFLVSATLADAQEPEAKPSVPAEGIHLFCQILHDLKLQPHVSLRAAVAKPAETVIIVLGNPQAINKVERGRLKLFIEAGGNLLIATEQPVGRDDLPVRFVSAPVVRFGEQRYRGKEHCPMLATDAPILGGPKLVGHPIFILLDKGIATNWPGRLDIQKPSVEPLLYFPPDAEDDIPMVYIAGSARNAPARGRELYIAGHGMFLNCMLAQTDSDNFKFTINALKWLRETTGENKRTRALLMVNGEIITDFNMNLTPPPPAPPLPPLRIVGRLIRGLEEERMFHHVLGDVMGDNAGMIVGILFGVVTFIVLIYAAKKFMEGRHHVDTTVPALVGAEPAITRTDAIDQRQNSLLRQGDFWEEARFLVLQWFRQELSVTPHRWLATIDARFHAEGFVLSRWRLQRQADEVLRIACSADAIRVTRSQFLRLVETLNDLSGALQSRRLALLVEGKNVRQP